MTVNKNNRLIFSIAVLLLIFFISVTGEAAQKRNILRIRFQTAIVKSTTVDTVLNVYYKLEVGRSPVNFNGFDCRFIFENTKIQPVPMDKQSGFFDGTASANADFTHGTAVPPDEYRVQVLSSHMLDTTNPILFQVRYTVKGVKDSAMIIPTLFDVASSGIDTVIIENSPSRDQISWYGFGLMFADTSKAPPAKKSITFLSDSTNIQSDSLKVISVAVTSLDGANLKSGTFGFYLDTSAFDSVMVLKGVILAGANLTVTRSSVNISAAFTSTNALKGSGEFLKIALRARKRADTICTTILNPRLNVLNADNLVSSIGYKINTICIFGKKDTVVKGVAEFIYSKDLSVMIFPNPSSSFIDFTMPQGQNSKKHLVVFDALGKKVFDKVFDAEFRWEVASVSAGFYTATVTNFSALQEGMKAETTKILIIH